MLSAIYAGLPDNVGTIMLFFVSNATVISIEDFIRPRSRGDKDSDTAWTRFLWVLSLLTWTYMSVPLFAYTALRLPVETNEIMPVSLVEKVGWRVMAGVATVGWAGWTLLGESV